MLNGFSADYSTIESGVPKGSVLGPLLFLIYINHLEKNIKSNVMFFADDTMLFSIVNDPVISVDELNHLFYVFSFLEKNKQVAEKISQSHGNPEIYKNITRKNKNITTNKINQIRL